MSKALANVERSREDTIIAEAADLREAANLRGAAETREISEKKKAPTSDVEPANLNPESAIRSILHAIPTLPESIELPAHLFSLLVENLDLRRAALLLPDYDEDLFVPWASNGLDETSLHRLRIPISDLNAAIGQSEAGLVWVGDNSRDFAPYFSRREATMLDNLLVFPFVLDGDLQSVLIITDTPYFEKQTEYLRIILAAVGEPAARVIQERRLAFSRLMRQSIVFKQSEIGVVSERVAEKASGTITAVLLQLADVVSQVATTNEYLDPYRVWQDVLRITTALFASTASVCDADGHRAMLLLHRAVGDDLDLLIHHVAATIADLLPELSTVPVLRFSSVRHPDDGTDIGSLVHALL